MSLAPIIPRSVFFEDHGEQDPQLRGCFYELRGWIVPCNRLIAIRPGTTEPTHLSRDALLDLMKHEPRCIAFPVLWLEEAPDEVFLVQSWRIWRPPDLVVGERVWTISGGEEVHIHGLDPINASRGEQESKKLMRWWRHSRFHNRKGAPPISDEAKAKRHQEMVNALNQLRPGERRTQQKLMAIMGVQGDSRRVREWLHQLGYSSWTDFLRKNVSQPL